MDTLPGTHVNTVDALLERYLALLDEYTTLRAELSRLQTATFQHLARANFTAERGVRHGQDYYDERMQAIRRVAVSSKAEGEGDDDGEEEEAAAAGESVAFRISKDLGHATFDVAESEAEGDTTSASAEAGDGQPTDDGAEDGDEDSKAKSQRSKDPLRWFGVLTPLALRQTQACAIDAVERVIPRLVTVDTAMRDLEIEVRRARKRRAKAEAAASKLELGLERGHLAKEDVAAS